MVSYKGYVAGWLNSSIHDALKDFPANLKGTKYALITCLDSNLDASSLLTKSPELKRLASKAQPLKRGLLLPTKLLLEADSSSQIFFGFDEVWFFPSEKIEPKPDSAWLVGPARIDQQAIDNLGKWISTNSCSLGLGDGEGLNFIVKAQQLAKHLLGHSLEQRQPNAPVVTSTPVDIAG